MWCCRLGNCLCGGDTLTPCASLPGLEEAVGCCEDPLRADEGPSTCVARAYFPGVLDADNPWPGPWQGTHASHDSVVSSQRVVVSHGPEPTGPSASTKSLLPYPAAAHTAPKSGCCQGGSHMGPGVWQCGTSTPPEPGAVPAAVPGAMGRPVHSQQEEEVQQIHHCQWHLFSFSAATDLSVCSSCIARGTCSTWG